MMWRILAILLLGSIVPARAETGLESFQHEAEKALGRPIKIVDSNETGIDLGQTYCDKNPVLIKLRAGLDPEFRDQVLAHELGHALLCSRGIVVFSVTTDTARARGVSEIASNLGSQISSCYIDPLADAEATQRGFKTDKMADEILRKSQTYTKEQIHEAVNRNGDLSAALPAVVTYCTDLLPHSFPISEMEKIVAGEPSVMTKLQALRRDLGKPQCSDSVSCFELAKRLRDELGLREFVVLINTRTMLFE